MIAGYDDALAIAQALGFVDIAAMQDHELAKDL